MDLVVLSKENEKENEGDQVRGFTRRIVNLIWYSREKNFEKSLKGGLILILSKMNFTVFTEMNWI